MTDKYILAEDGKTPVREPDLLKWTQWFETNGRDVACTDLDGGVCVSTVFRGLDHSFAFNSDAPPMLWETMIFGGPHNHYMDRYTSYEAALAGHAKALEICAGRLREDES